MDLEAPRKGVLGSENSNFISDHMFNAKSVTQSKDDMQAANSRNVTPETLFAFSILMLGAISKSIATSLTYLAIRCKIMVQAAYPNDGEA